MRQESLPSLALHFVTGEWAGERNGIGPRRHPLNRAGPEHPRRHPG